MAKFRKFAEELEEFRRAEPQEEFEVGHQSEIQDEDDADEMDSDDSKYDDSMEEDDDDDDEGSLDDDDSMGDDDDDRKDELSEENEEKEESKAPGVQLFSKSSDELGKALATKQQIDIWDSLMEARIRLQQLLYSTNQLPPAGEMRSEAEENIEQLLKSSQSKTEEIEGKLMKIQKVLVKNNPELQGARSGKENVDDNDDEEILSSEDDAENDETTPIDIMPSILHYRNNVLPFWEDKTRVAGMKKGFEAFHRPAIQQISQIMADKDRLVKRTKQIRGDYKILGVSDLEGTEGSLDTHDEIFDDDDFYGELLHELIKNKSDSLSDPLEISSHWAKMQRSKVKKKKVDTRASKERKIRYNVHTKLVNLMAPVEKGTWSDEASSELFKNLFTS